MNAAQRTPHPTHEPWRIDHGFGLYLALTAAVAGAAVMMVEVLGARLIAPFFGVSLFVWTALISVTLIALAVGYFAGGIVADRSKSPDALYWMLITAGVLVALAPAIKAPVLKACMLLGLRAGALCAALALFAPSLLLLGAVSPFVLRIAVHRTERVGRTAGTLYAISTLGSFAGTVGTGFYLIALAGVERIFLLTGTTLIAVGGVYFILYRRRPLMALAVLIPPLLLLVGNGNDSMRQLPDGTRVTRVASRDSFYGNIKVIDYAFGTRQLRELVIDGLVQGGVDLASGQSVYEYGYLAEHLPRAIVPDGNRCLVIGLGIGVLPSRYRALGVETDVVDIDPAVVEMARRHFGLDEGLNVHVADARRFLLTTRERYDYIVLDVFNGDTTPAHLLSVEAMRLLRERLREGGVLAVNLIGDIGPRGTMTASVVKTMREVFARVEVRPTFEPAQAGTIGNLILLAHSGAPTHFEGVDAAIAQVHPLARAGVYLGLTREVEPAAGDGIVLTDDFNPIDVDDLTVKEHVRRQILESTDWDILLGRLRQSQPLPG